MLRELTDQELNAVAGGSSNVIHVQATGGIILVSGSQKNGSTGGQLQTHEKITDPQRT